MTSIWQTQTRPSHVNELMPPSFLHCSIESFNMEVINNTLLFNQTKALEASHNDEEVMMKLRGLLIQVLPDQLDQAIHLWQEKDSQALQTLLHHILGGAKVCAAERLIETIVLLKDELKNQNQQSIEMLWNELKIINQSMQHFEHSQSKT